MTKPLKLIAQSAADIDLLSAHIQDSVVQIADMLYQPQAHRFICMLNRYMWERVGDNKQAQNPSGWRIRSALRVEIISGLRQRDIPLQQPQSFLSLLSLQVQDDKLRLLFAQAGEIELTCEGIHVILEDVGAPRKAVAQPQHKDID